MSSRRSRMPDPRIPFRCFVGAVVSAWPLLVLALVAWLYRPTTLADRVDKIDADVKAMELEAKRR